MFDIKRFTSVYNRIAISSDGKYVACEGREGIETIWDMTNKEEFMIFEVGDTIRCSCFSPNAELLIGAIWYKHEIYIWDIKNKKREILKGHSNPLEYVEYSPIDDFLLSGSIDNIIKIWDIKNRMEIQTLVLGPTDINQGRPVSIKFNPECDLIAIGHWKSKIHLLRFNRQNKKPAKSLKILDNHSSGVNDVAFSPDGKYLASGSADETIKIWDVNTESHDFGQCLYTIKQQINCEGMNITGVRGLDKEKMKFLAKRGAIGVSKGIMEEIREAED